MDIAYLDNSVVSAKGKREASTELSPLEDLFQRHIRGEIRLVTSEITHREISSYLSSHRTPIETVYLHLQQVPVIEAQRLVGINSYWDVHGGWNSPMIEDDAIWRTIQRIGLDSTDAHHLMVAVRNSCDVFLTLDRRTILRFREELSKTLQLRLRLPSEYLVELRASGA